MEKLAQMAILLDIYGGLLTDRQRDVLDLYYNHDLTLSEIAEHHDISRQGVHDLLKRGEHTLRKMDEKLNLFERWTDLEIRLEKTAAELSAMGRQSDGEWFEKAEKNRQRSLELSEELYRLMRIFGQ